MPWVAAAAENRVGPPSRPRRAGCSHQREGEAAKGRTWLPDLARVSFEDLAKDFLRDYEINGRRSIGKARTSVAALTRRFGRWAGGQHHDDRGSRLRGATSPRRLREWEHQPGAGRPQADVPASRPGRDSGAGPLHPHAPGGTAPGGLLRGRAIRGGPQLSPARDPPGRSGRLRVGLAPPGDSRASMAAGRSHGGVSPPRSRDHQELGGSARLPLPPTPGGPPGPVGGRPENWSGGAARSSPGSFTGTGRGFSGSWDPGARRAGRLACPG